MAGVAQEPAAACWMREAADRAHRGWAGLAGVVLWEDEAAAHVSRDAPGRAG